MRKDIGANTMNSKIKLISALLVVFMLFGISSCGKKYSDDVIAIAGYLQYFDQPENVVIYKLEKSEFADETIYYVSRGKYDEYDSADEIELLIVYDPSSKTTETAFFLDMEYGMHSDIKALWDSREIIATSSYEFSDEEIKSIIAEVAEYCQK